MPILLDRAPRTDLPELETLAWRRFKAAVLGHLGQGDHTGAGKAAVPILVQDAAAFQSSTRLARELPQRFRPRATPAATCMPPLATVLVPGPCALP